MIKNENFKIRTHIIKRLIYGNRCRICGKISELNKDICDTCITDKIRVSQETLLSFSYTDKNFDNLTAPFYYDKPIIKCIHNFKYKNFKRAGEYLASELIDVISRNFCDETPDFITCVPMTKRRRFRKNYNHGEVLIKYISEAFSVKASPHLLKKTKNTRPQVGLPEKERLKNLKGAFAVNCNFDIKNKTILICDDVISTGSTLEECAKALRKAGAKRVICAVCALNNKNF